MLIATKKIIWPNFLGFFKVEYYYEDFTFYQDFYYKLKFFLFPSWEWGRQQKLRARDAPQLIKCLLAEANLKFNL